MQKKLPLILWLISGFMVLGGCDRRESPDSNPTQPSTPAMQVPTKKAPATVDAKPDDTDEVATKNESTIEAVAEEVETVEVAETIESIEIAPLPAGVDEFVVEKFVFQFHKETKAETCGDWDYFAYNGSMSISGRIQSLTPIDMTETDFELDLTTPFESYILPARRERETLSGQDVAERVIVSKGKGSIFYVKNYRVDDDETVYRNDDDETGTLKNYGPLIDAVFDWKNQKFIISITRAELTAEDLDPGEIFEFSLLMPRLFPENEDFDQTTEFRYTGSPIHTENYEYTGDCP